jgi:hypothetical protein
MPFGFPPETMFTFTGISNLEQRVPDFIVKRMAFAAETREDQKNHFDGREKLKEHLLGVAEADFPTWLPAETMTASGLAIISGHLERISGGPGPQQAWSLAFLQSAVSVASKGLVRADCLERVPTGC